MYLPKPFEAFSADHPELIKLYQELGKACREAGPLDAKSQELVKLGIAIGANSGEGSCPQPVRHWPQGPQPTKSPMR